MTVVHHVGVTIDELEWFVALAETEHMTKAAARLNISQPTLSRGLARLEREVGTPLFDRVNRRLRLNRFGRLLLGHARRSLQELDTASLRIRSLRDPEHGEIRLGFLHSVATWLAPELIRGFREHTPGVRFTLVQAATFELLQHLRADEVDLALTGPRPQEDGLGWRPLHTEQLCLVVPTDHRLADREHVELSEAGSDPFVLLGPDFGLRRLVDHLFVHAGVTPEIAFESIEIATMEALVAAGLGVSVVPRPLPHRAEPNAVYIPLADPGAQRQLGLVWRATQPLTPVVERFVLFVNGAAHFAEWLATP